MKKLLRHGRNSKSSSGGGGDYKWIRLDMLVSTYSSPGLIPIHAVAVYTPTMPHKYSSRIAVTHNPNEKIITQTSVGGYFPAYDDTQPNSIFTGNDEHPNSIAFRYQSYDSGWIKFSDTVVINGLSHYVYYNADGTKLLPEDIYGPHLFYLWGYQINAPLSNYYVLI